MSRFTAYTVDMEPLYYTSSPDELSAWVLEHIRRRSSPRLAYTYDSAPHIQLRYTFWDIEKDGSITKVTRATAMEVILLYRATGGRDYRDIPVR